MEKLDPKIRPGAGGHRFGPDLQCSECGRYWDAHQQNPRPCSISRERKTAGAFVIAAANDEPEAEFEQKEPDAELEQNELEQALDLSKPLP